MNYLCSRGIVSSDPFFFVKILSDFDVTIMSPVAMVSLQPWQCPP